MSKKRQKRREPRIPSWIPFGFRMDTNGIRVFDKLEQTVLSVSKDLRTRGHTLDQICAELTQSGFRNRMGNPYSRNTVHRILRAEGVTQPPLGEMRRVSCSVPVGCHKGLEQEAARLSTTPSRLMRDLIMERWPE